MTTLHQLTDNCLAVAGLPSDAEHYAIAKTKNGVFRLLISDEKITHTDSFELPTGNWRILGNANELTEEQWKEVVEEIHKGAYVNYDKKTRRWKDYNWDFYTDTATESGASLLKLHKLDNPLILIKDI